MSDAILLTVLTKVGGPLTKRIYLNADGKVVSDGSACIMWSGSARRMTANGKQLASLIEYIPYNQAIALGRLRADIPDEIPIVTKAKLNGPGAITRTKDNIVFLQGEPAFALFDFDKKGMPTDVALRLNNLGGLWGALITILPELRDVTRIVRLSTSAGLTRADTGEQLPGSGGQHVYIVVKNGADIERFLKTMHERCWIAGLGWMMVGAAGQLLDRSIVDHTVGDPSRLVFEGAPVVEFPLEQDKNLRRPTVAEGNALDSVAACLPLTIVEKQKLRKLRAEAALLLAPEVAKIRGEFIVRRTQEIMARTNLSADEAKKVAERQCGGVLFPDVELEFDDPDLSGLAVGDVLDNPARFEGCTLADPLDGIAYGPCKAKVMQRADGTPFIHSLAHGLRTIYELRFNARTVRVKIEQAGDPVDAFVKLALTAELDEVEIKQLLDLAAQRAGVGVRAVAAKLKMERKRHAKQCYEEARERRLIARTDLRPMISAPPYEAPWLPQMDALNDVIRESSDKMRSASKVVASMQVRVVADMHEFVDANEEEETKE